MPEGVFVTKSYLGRNEPAVFSALITLKIGSQMLEEFLEEIFHERISETAANNKPIESSISQKENNFRNARKNTQARQRFEKIDGIIETKRGRVIEYNKKYGGHFAKIIKIDKIKYILIYFNSEKDLLQAIYKSTMDEDIGKGLQMKGRKSVDAPSDPLSTIPRSKEEHEMLDDLNNKFSERLEIIEKTIDDSTKSDKKKKSILIEDEINGNKRVIRIVVEYGGGVE
ncbi:hypothetical protein RhiirA4_466241 [Rhizophagus irregularis]|uniref:Uncharacterized protein n=1 Tax=Rhizophagus irregularis TaxID=588596 RepID=A0A2I1GTP1_9GLOM|nr:hypothetical protein RhiirA4_466241 [Rhizophagus irregularis]